MHLETIKKELKERLNLEIVRSKYFIHDSKEWSELIIVDCEGFFLPRSLTAHLKRDSEFLQLNIIHEYLGHGIYCESSAYGIKLVSLEKELSEIEKKILETEELPKDIKFVLKPDNPFFQEYSQKRKELETFAKDTLNIYEGFATWMEYFCSKLTASTNLFEKKSARLSSTDMHAFEQLKRIEDNYSTEVMLYSVGFPKIYDERKLQEIVKTIFKRDLEEAKMVLIYGSKKPYSDIDLFIVSDKIKSQNHGWLDVFSVTEQEFEIGINMLDVAITDPIFSGEVITGERNLLESLKTKILRQKITEESIKYNLQKSEEQKDLALNQPENSYERKVGLSYHTSYKQNANKLTEGMKALTLSNLF